MSEKVKENEAGTFNVHNVDLYGELTVRGPKSEVRLRSEAPFEGQQTTIDCIHGVLHDLRKVSLFNCVISEFGHFSRMEKRIYFAKAFPHFVIRGDSHIRPTEESISSIRFSIDDGFQLFYDFDAFGKLFNPSNYISAIVAENEDKLKREIRVGDEPEIVYFTGHRKIFEANIGIGSVGAEHNPITSIGGPKGISITNKISITVNFYNRVDFNVAVEWMISIVRYFGLIMGRQQNIVDISLIIADRKFHEQYLNVEHTMAGERKSSEERPQPSDVLVNPVRDAKTFGTIMSKYFERETGWKASRSRFATTFNKGIFYDIDRLVAIANTFDIIPDTAFPINPQTPSDVLIARDEARKLFKALPISSERDSVLNALGRVGKMVLKKKIAARVQLISDRISELPELSVVADRAVDCRNFFVHGGKKDFEYSDHSELLGFFVDTLEFIFGASDLIESGWNIAQWVSDGTVMSHPFGAFKACYRWNLNRLQEVLLSNRNELE